MSADESLVKFRRAWKKCGPPSDTSPEGFHNRKVSLALRYPCLTIDLLEQIVSQGIRSREDSDDHDFFAGLITQAHSSEVASLMNPLAGLG